MGEGPMTCTSGHSELSKGLTFLVSVASLKESYLLF